VPSAKRPAAQKRSPQHETDSVWSSEWRALIEAYGIPGASFTENWKRLAETIGVSSQAVWRYAKGDNVPQVAVNFIRVLAAQKGLKSPV
jgi:hypothetical protein